MEWPLVTVIVLNYNGKSHLKECFDSLLALNYPSAKVELMLVDNDSQDESIAFMQETFPTVRLMESGGNLGFAGGNNFGASQATGTYIAFLNNDTRVDTNWLQELVRPCLETGTVCTGSKMLSWKGDVVDFVRSGMNFHAFAFQPFHGTPDTFYENRPLLFACGGAMLIRRDVFLDVGGFDNDFFMYFEDMDLGWRLWVLGYDVQFAPKSIVYHKVHASSNKLASSRRWVLFERNALYALIKNYSDENLTPLLSGSLLLMFRRSARLLQEHGWQAHVYSVHNQQPVDEFESVSRLGLSVLYAANEVIDQLPMLFEKRRQIQQRRQRSDQEIFEKFDLPLFTHFLLHKDAKAHYDVTHFLGINQIFQGVPRRVLLLAEQPEQDTGSPASVYSVVPFAIGRQIESMGHQVYYGIPHSLTAGHNRTGTETPFGIYRWTPPHLNEIIAKINPEILIVLDEKILQLACEVGLPVVHWPWTDHSPVDLATTENGASPADLLLTHPPTAMNNGAAKESGDVLPIFTEAECVALDAYLRDPIKRYPASSRKIQTDAASPPPFTQPLPAKSFVHLIQESVFHLRQDGLLGFIYNVLGFLQKQIGKRL